MPTSTKRKIYLLALKAGPHQLSLYKQLGRDKGDAASRLYDWLRREGVVSLPPLAWVVEFQEDREVQHLTTIQISE